MVGALRCEECGCASHGFATHWTAFLAADPMRAEPPRIVVLCPVCAADEFDYRPKQADAYT